MFFGTMMLIFLMFLLFRSVAWARGPRFYVAPQYRPLEQPKQPAQLQQSAMEILRERYARGEIDTDTFEQMAERLVRYENIV